VKSRLLAEAHSHTQGSEETSKKQERTFESSLKGSATGVKRRIDPLLRLRARRSSNGLCHGDFSPTNENTFPSNRSYYICLPTKQQLLPRYFLSDLPQLPTMNLYNILILFSAIAFGTITAENALLGNENSTTIHQRIRNERRFVLFNSRRLSGDCLAGCDTSSPTSSPSMDPTLQPIFFGTPRNPSPTTSSPTERPVPTNIGPILPPGKGGSKESSKSKGGSNKSKEKSKGASYKSKEGSHSKAESDKSKEKSKRASYKSKEGSHSKAGSDKSKEGSHSKAGSDKSKEKSKGASYKSKEGSHSNAGSNKSKEKFKGTSYKSKEGSHSKAGSNKSKEKSKGATNQPSRSTNQPSRSTNKPSYSTNKPSNSTNQPSHPTNRRLHSNGGSR